MNPIAILLLGFAMSTDAFAAAIGKGAAMGRPRLAEAVRAGLIFGCIEAITPVLGWWLGRGASRYIQEWDHWVAFVLLLGLGLHMIWTSLMPAVDQPAGMPRKHGFISLALTGLSTSIDALAVGVGLAFVDVPIVAVAVVIGLCTFGMVTLGVMLGRMLSAMVGRGAELAGGVVLIGVGAVILYEHLSA
ncbi:MAG TPA: manganese efflux pump MntP family protein [Rhodanobacter sp.]|jgi:putative Mn2+ efflux pump MntP|nr:manganese efflux pump MntP family protein [Rhodanobacter sp.]